MKAVGGFFELEVADGGRTYHPDAVAFCSGRASLARILEVARPSGALVPFYICDTALIPFRAAGIAIRFYGLDDQFDPCAGVERRARECMLYVNYFGLKSRTAARLVRQAPDATIIDDTQAFFQRGYGGGWTFNSARKFFGVPDGAYAYGRDLAAPTEDATEVSCAHLVNRLEGRQDLAYQQFVAAEARVPAEPRRMSHVASRLLSNVDYESVREARRANFRRLHAALVSENRVGPALDDLCDAVPLYYPFHPRRAVARERLWQCGLFVPALWPEVLERGDDGFDFERRIAAELLPLPIDHRYDAGDMDWVVATIRKELDR